MNSCASLQTRLRAAARSRVGGLCCVLEHIENDSNRAAILRAVEALGLLHVHEINLNHSSERRAKHDQVQRARSVENGCERWLQVHHHHSVSACVNSLRAQGYFLCAAVAPNDSEDGAACIDTTGAIAQAARHHREIVSLKDIDFSVPIALVFGNERRGLTKEMRTACDSLFTIPMRGLSESLNVGVASAIALHWGRAARERCLRKLSAENETLRNAKNPCRDIESIGDLNEIDRQALELEYFKVAALPSTAHHPASQFEARV